MPPPRSRPAARPPTPVSTRSAGRSRVRRKQAQVARSEPKASEDQKAGARSEPKASEDQKAGARSEPKASEDQKAGARSEPKASEDQKRGSRSESAIADSPQAAPPAAVLDRLRAFARTAEPSIFAALDGAELIERSDEQLRIRVSEPFAARRLRERQSALDALAASFFGRATRVLIEDAPAAGSAA